MKYTLLTPIKNVLGKDMTELTLRSYVTVGDFRAAHQAAGSDAYEWTCEIVCRLTGLDKLKELVQLDVRDFNRLDKILAELQKDPDADPKDDGLAPGPKF